MSKGPQKFKQGDVTRALKGAVNAGLAVKRVEIDRDGRIVVITEDMLKSVRSSVNEWDDVR